MEATNITFLSANIATIAHMSSMATTHYTHIPVPKTSKGASTKLSFSDYSHAGRYTTSFTWQSMNQALILQIPIPVYVEDDQLIYNSAAMEIGKLYEVEYQGEKWALKKTEKDIEFLKFYHNE